MGVAYCLVVPEVAARLREHASLTVETLTDFGEGVLHIAVRGPSVPDGGSWMKQVVIDGDHIAFKDDTDV